MEELDLPRLTLFENYYGRHPPVHIMVANYLGIKSTPATQSSAPAAEATSDQFNALLEMMPVSEPENYMTSEQYLAEKEKLNVK